MATLFHMLVLKKENIYFLRLVFCKVYQESLVKNYLWEKRLYVESPFSNVRHEY